MTDTTCPTCDGAGELTACANDGSHGCSHTNDRTWTCTDCNGTGHQQPSDAGYLATAITFAVCIFGVLLFLGLIHAGRAAMCATHDNQLRYCPGYVAVQR